MNVHRMDDSFSSKGCIPAKELKFVMNHLPGQVCSLFSCRGALSLS